MSKGTQSKRQSIIKLKNYLQQFGYLSHSNSKHQAQGDHDDFDDVLESAIKTYQTNYNLAISGNLDSKTVSTIYGDQASLWCSRYHQLMARAG